MPDGDRIYNAPAGQGLNKAYNMLLERQLLSDIAFQIQTELAALLRKYGNEPRALIEQTIQMVSEAIQAVKEGGDLQIEVMSHAITTFAEQMLGHRRGMPIAVDTCKASLLDITTGESADTLQKTISESYVWRVYDADFAERLPLYFHDPRVNMSQGELNNILIELRGEMQKHVVTLAERFIRLDDVKKVTRANRGSNIATFDNDNDDDIHAPSL